MSIRTATRAESAVLASIINEAFVVEAFFKIGDRTSADEVTALMNSGGEFLVLENVEPGTGTLGTPVGCVFLKQTRDRAYFGMLSVAPAHQGKNFGRQLIDAVEARARERGCTVMDIHIVNLREELFPYYRSLGYQETGTLPFPDTDRASRPCHFIVMSKPL